MKVLIKQWKRSSMIGFIRRMRDYLIGRECISCHRRHMLMQTRVKIKEAFYEKWACVYCGAKSGEIF